jgi:hypothetical protein
LSLENKQKGPDALRAFLFAGGESSGEIRRQNPHDEGTPDYVRAKPE